MTTATPTLPTNTGYVVGQVWPTARWLLRTAVFLGAWMWGIVVVVVTVVTLAVASVGEPDVSIVAFARYATIWFPLSTFIIVTAVHLPVHIAAGLTRRSLAHGAITAAVVTAVGNGVVFSALLLVERAVYAAAGWQWRFFDDLSAGAPPSTFIPGSFLTYLVAYLSGLLIGVVYRRGGGWWGTLTLPLTVGPILLVSALFAADIGLVAPDAWGGGGGVPSPVAVTLGLALAAVVAFAFDRLVRGAAVPARTA